MSLDSIARAKLAIATLALLAAAGLIVTAIAVEAAPKNPRNLVALVTVAPSEVTSPVTAGAPLTVCISGLSEGNFASIGVPWISNDGIHVSRISFSRYVDASGGFCVQAPPSWTELRLVPGTYSVISRVAATGRDDTLPGPTATLTVTQ